MKMMQQLKEKQQFNKDIVQKLTVTGALLVMCVFFSLISPYFLTFDNFMTIALQTAITGVTACGLTFVIISGAVDLSIGSNIAFTGVIVTMLIVAGFPLWLAIPLCLLVGAVVGCINGFMVAKMELPPFIATLGMQMAIRGFALVITNARPIYIGSDHPLASTFKALAQTRLWKTIPLPVIYMIFIAILATFILRKTVVGRNVFAVGSNEEAAKLSGLSTLKLRMFAYTCSGVTAAVAGVILASRTISGQPAIAVGYEANAVAAAVIGGASMRGGQGSISGSILGAFIMGVLMNGLNLMGVNQNWQTFATGIVMILAVYIDIFRRSKSGN